MDDLERMYRHLVRTVRTKYAPLLTQPFEVGELYQTIMPYRLHRRELGLETNQNYEMVLLELLTGARGYLVVDGRMRDMLEAQLFAPTPNTAVIRDFAAEHVAFAPEALHRLDNESRGTGAQSAVGGTPARPASPTRRTGSGAFPANGTPGASTPAAVAGDPVARRTPKPVTADAGELCRFCKGELPVGRQLSFCPHCGQDLTVVHCPACGADLEHGWKFCATCGRTAAEL
jgi:hypothetical protein